MTRDGSEQAAHALRTRAPALAEATVAEQYRLQPDLTARYGPDGRRHCVRDVEHHVQFLAASVEWGGASPSFVRYVRWAHGVLAARGIAASDFLMTLRAMRQALPGVVPPAAADAACRHVEAAIAQFPPPEPAPS